MNLNNITHKYIIKCKLSQNICERKKIETLKIKLPLNGNSYALR